MDVPGYLHPGASPDATWDMARHYVNSTLKLSSPVIRLIKLGWEANITQPEFVKLVGGARLNVSCLLDAAKILGDGRKPDMEQVVIALNTLGLSSSAIVISVNLVTRLALKSKPPALWAALLKEMMSAIEIGSIVGSKVPEFGASCGSLMGFAPYAGQLILLTSEAKAFKEWRFQSQKLGKVGRKIELDLFGCEVYQVAALAMQHLGFGIDVAVGTAIGVGQLDPRHIKLERNVTCWKAAILWIDALRRGRNFPSELSMREFFPQIAPSRDPNEKNLNLGVLYTEVSKVKSSGSDWTWHLPFPSYEKTQEEWKLT